MLENEADWLFKSESTDRENDSSRDGEVVDCTLPAGSTISIDVSTVDEESTVWELVEESTGKAIVPDNVEELEGREFSAESTGRAIVPVNTEESPD